MCQGSSSWLLLSPLPWDILPQLKPNLLPVQPHFVAGLQHQRGSARRAFQRLLPNKLVQSQYAQFQP